MAGSSIKITEGTGKKVATYEIEESGEKKELQRSVLNDEEGAPLVGRRPGADSVPMALDDEALAAIVKLQGGKGWVAIPAAADTPLSPPARAVVVASAGNLVLEGPQGVATPVPIPVQPGMTFVVETVRKAAGNTCAVVGIL